MLLAAKQNSSSIYYPRQRRRATGVRVARRGRTNRGDALRMNPVPLDVSVSMLIALRKVGSAATSKRCAWEVIAVGLWNIGEEKASAVDVLR